MKPPSLRSALIIASILWTAGLLAMVHMAMLALIHTVPGIRGSHGHGVIVAAILCIAAAVVTVRSALHPLEQIGRASERSAQGLTLAHRWKLSAGSTAPY